MKTKDLETYLVSYNESLINDELSPLTIKKYNKDICNFLLFVNSKAEIEKFDLLNYKKYLLVNYKISSVNSFLVSINRFFIFIGLKRFTVKTIHIQKKTHLENVISFEEYKKLLERCLSKGNYKLYLIIKTLGSTGIRISELKHITIETAIKREAHIFSKGKSRLIIIPSDLSILLIDYCKNHLIDNGIIFYGRNKNFQLHPTGIWKSMKTIANESNIDIKKVYPHSLRHLFAKTYMKKIGNMFELADLLGHSNIETTRIYSYTSINEKQESINKLGL